MSLTDEQCAEIAAWARGRAAAAAPPRVVVDFDRVPGSPLKAPGPLVGSLHVHPEDYLALQRWSDRMARFDL